MSYRDDVDAIFQRAEALQREVDRLEAELAARDQPADPPDPKTSKLPPPPAVPDGNRFPSPSEVSAHMQAIAARAVWLPPRPPASSRPPPQPRPATAHDLDARLARLEPRFPPEPIEIGSDLANVDGHDHDAVGVLVARLTPNEHAAVMRLLELMTDDDFSDEGVERNLTRLDRLLVTLRLHLRRRS